jgi:hypothetical protein|tara:strand:- start:416 stop:667 length:252 start_codon:yes stop_codon:yes gene_type:complete
MEVELKAKEVFETEIAAMEKTIEELKQTHDKVLKAIKANEILLGGLRSNLNDAIADDSMGQGINDLNTTQVEIVESYPEAQTD